MKAVLLSIQPRWCELIASGEKTVEVRKTKPKLGAQFKCYIYQTKREWSYDRLVRQDRLKTALTLDDGRGKVIGEFICALFMTDRSFGHDPLFLAAACMSEAEAAAYCVNSETYGWCISDLVIYDKPKPLSAFYRACRNRQETDCSVCVDLGKNKCGEIKRPPQSWMYVEEV